MKVFLKFASIPLVLFALFFGIPRLFAVLLNSHTDVGIVAALVLLCGLCGFILTKLYNLYMKEIENERP